MPRSAGHQRGFDHAGQDRVDADLVAARPRRAAGRRFWPARRPRPWPPNRSRNCPSGRVAFIEELITIEAGGPVRHRTLHRHRIACCTVSIDLGLVDRHDVVPASDADIDSTPASPLSVPALCEGEVEPAMRGEYGRRCSAGPARRILHAVLAERARRSPRRARRPRPPAIRRRTPCAPSAA